MSVSSDARAMLPPRASSALLSGGVVSAQSPELAFYALCAADPLAWLAADLALLVPFFKNMMHMNYQYLYGGVEQHLLGK